MSRNKRAQVSYNEDTAPKGKKKSCYDDDDGYYDDDEYYNDNIDYYSDDDIGYLDEEYVDVDTDDDDDDDYFRPKRNRKSYN